LTILKKAVDFAKVGEVTHREDLSMDNAPDHSDTLEEIVIDSFVHNWPFQTNIEKKSDKQKLVRIQRKDRSNAWKLLRIQVAWVLFKEISEDDLGLSLVDRPETSHWSSNWSTRRETGRSTTARDNWRRNKEEKIPTLHIPLLVSNLSLCLNQSGILT
jgi:hypothetical protein